MENNTFEGFSLLYPDTAKKEARLSGRDTPKIDAFTLEELGLAEVFPLKNGSLDEFVTADPAVIRYREAVFGDLLAHEEIGATFAKLMPVLFDVAELRRLEADSGDAADYLSSMTEIELYITVIDTLYHGICENGAMYESEAVSRLAAYIRELVESDYYAELNKRLSELTSRVREIKSVTIGVNLDAQLRPNYAGVLSVNAEPFRSGDTLAKILRLGKENDAFTCIANLSPVAKHDNQEAMTLAFYRAIGDVYRQSLRSWKKIVQNYVLENTDFLLDLLPEFEFLLKGANLLRALIVKGNKLTVPEIAPAAERRFAATGLYNPAVALKVDDRMVTNDVVFDENAAIYVLTGPNRGGKSVITCAVGLCQAMMQLGLPVPAESAVISPADGIFTHFPTGADDTIDKGRLGEECARLGEIFDAVTPESLVLLDESLSSTGAFEASYIAAEVLAGLSRVGCRCIFSTHLHELAAEVPAINERMKAEGGAPIDTLVAGMQAGERSFRILRAKPEGKSYAGDIAARYGLSYDSIMKKIKAGEAARGKV